MSIHESEEGDDSFLLAFVSVLSVLGAFAYWIYYNSNFATFYLLMAGAGVLLLGMDLSQIRTDLEDPEQVVMWSAAGYVLSLLAVMAMYRAALWLGSATMAATIYPFAASTLQIYWIQLQSNVFLVQLWYYLVTAGATMFVATAENLLFFGAALTMLAGSVEETDGERDNHFANIILVAVMAFFFGMFHVYTVYGAANYWDNFLANPVPIAGLMTLGAVWGFMTIYVGLVPSIIVHWMWNMSVVLIGISAMAQIMAGGGLILLIDHYFKGGRSKG